MVLNHEGPEGRMCICAGKETIPRLMLLDRNIYRADTR